MAYDERELYDSADKDAFPRIGPKRVLPCTFGTDAAETELAVGTPVAFDEANFVWVAWSASGTGDVDEIKGFIYPDALQLSATGEVIGQVMVEGDIHYDDIVLPDGESATDLREALRTDCLARGLVVRGLSKIR